VDSRFQQKSGAEIGQEKVRCDLRNESNESNEFVSKVKQERSKEDEDRREEDGASRRMRKYDSLDPW
jgi:hypothetical protein